ncbi:MAG TPA: ABC transporter substrate-binding protein [Xanthobacteraceae bacterium]|jgi:putative ABC transport system substrate-binding protein
MNRRDFITLVGGAAAWPLAARAQGERMRRLGVLAGGAENDPGSPAATAALWEGLAKLGWIEGRNLRIDFRFGAGELDRIRADAAELVSLAPDVIVANSAAATKAAQQQTQTIPIVFTAGGDAAVNGLVRNIARPEGNTTGFTTSEPSAAGKSLGLLKEAAPHLTRVAIVFNPELAQTAPSFIAAIEAAAPALAVQAIIKVPVRNAVDIVRGIDAFATEPNGGLLMLPPPNAGFVETINQLTAKYRLPAISSSRDIVAAGGLMAYGTDLADLSRRAAFYIDRLLRGAKVTELPIQFPTKYVLVINVKTAKAIGLTIPESLLLRADELIE